MVTAAVQKLSSIMATRFASSDCRIYYFPGYSIHREHASGRQYCSMNCEGRQEEDRAQQRGERHGERGTERIVNPRGISAGSMEQDSSNMIPLGELDIVLAARKPQVALAFGRITTKLFQCQGLLALVTHS